MFPSKCHKKLNLQSNEAYQLTNKTNEVKDTNIVAQDKYPSKIMHATPPPFKSLQPGKKGRSCEKITI